MKLSKAIAIVAISGCLVIFNPPWSLIQSGSVNAIAQEFQTQRSEADSLQIEGIHQFNQGHTNYALEIFQEVLSLRQAITDRENQGWSYFWIGRAYARLGEYELAFQHYQQSLALHILHRNKLGEGLTLSSG